LKYALDDSAAKSGRSQSQEAEFRLERSFHDQDLLNETMTLAYGSEGGAILAIIGAIIREVGFWAPQIAIIDKSSNGRWIDNRFLFDEVVGALNQIFGRLRPTDGAAPPKQFAALLDGIGQRNLDAILAIIANPDGSNTPPATRDWGRQIRVRLGDAGARLLVPKSSPTEPSA